MIHSRNTIQRGKILGYLCSVDTHPSAEMIFQSIRADTPNISLATVYRNLNQMAEMGVINKVHVGGQCRFDGDTSDHIHQICNKCGKIQDLHNDSVSDYALKNTKTNEFTAETISIILRGECVVGCCDKMGGTIQSKYSIR